MTPADASRPLRRRVVLAILALAAAIAVLPLALHGCSCGHDFDFHLLNWLEIARQFREGNLHPQWAVTPAWNAGEPRFVFYPPLSWTLGALLTLGAASAAHLLSIAPATTFAATPILYTWLVLFAAGAALFHVAQAYTGRSAALLAATLYSTNPYALFTAYERTAYAELLCMVWLPLLVAAMLPKPSPPRPQPPSIAAIATLVALLWLSNAPGAIIGCYLLAFLAAVRLTSLARGAHGLRTAISFTTRVVAGVALGLALAAVFLIPALAERPWVQLRMAILPGMRPEDNTLFHHTTDAAHDAVLHAASLVAVILLAATTLALLAFWLRQRPSGAAIPSKTSSPSEPRTSAMHDRSQQQHLLLLLFASATAALGLMLTPLADPIWQHLPELTYLQFPWRLLAALAPIFALAVALALRDLRLRALPAALVALAFSFILSLPAYQAFHQSCDPEDTPQARYAQFTAPAGQDPGSEPTDEYTPAAADNDSLADHNPPYRLLDPQDPTDTSPPSGAVSYPAPHQLHLDLKTPALLVLNLRDYPAWLVLRNGAPLQTRVARADGLLTIPLPAGASTLRICYRTTAAERAAEATSASALGVLAFLVFRERRGSPSRSTRL